MTLHEVSNNTWVRLLSDAETPMGCPNLISGRILKFVRPDGLFAYCLTLKGDIVRPIMACDVETITIDMQIIDLLSGSASEFVRSFMDEPKNVPLIEAALKWEIVGWVEKQWYQYRTL